jgi:hypothetical protein
MWPGDGFASADTTQFGEAITREHNRAAGSTAPGSLAIVYLYLYTHVSLVICGERDPGAGRSAFLT